MNLSIYKDNSIRLLQENIEIAQTDEIISAIIEQKRLSSLAYDIAEVNPIHGPTGGTFALIYDEAQHKTKLIRGEVQVTDDSIEQTGFTVEAIQDLERQFGKYMPTFVGKALAGISAQNENTYLLQQLDSFATQYSDLILSDSSNSETNLLQLQQTVAEIIVKINHKYFHSWDAFAIIPSNVAAAAMAYLPWNIGSDKIISDMFLGNSARIKYYINPDPESTKAYVGIKSEVPGNSSIILSPYQHSLVTAINDKTGETDVFNINRYAITQSANSQISPMLYSFDVQTF